MENEKMTFAKTINSLDKHFPESRSDCFEYGSWYGCDFECPQLRRGECQGDISVILGTLEDDEVITLFEDGFYQKEIMEFMKSKKNKNIKL